VQAGASENPNSTDLSILFVPISLLPVKKNLSGSFIGMRSLIKLCSSAEKAGEFAYLDIFFNLLNGELAFEGYYKGLFSGILPQIR